MKKGIKQSLFISGILAGCLAIGVAATVGTIHLNDNLQEAEADGYSLTLNSTNTPANLTSSYQDNISSVITTSNGNNVVFGFINARTASSSFVELSSRGMIYNLQPLNGLTDITVTTSSGSVYCRSANTDVIDNSGLFLGEKILLSNGVKTNVINTNHIQLIAGDSGAKIQSIVFGYTCSPANDVRTLNGSYTGEGNDGYTYKLTLNNSIASLVTLDKKTNVPFTNGTASLSGSTLTCSFTNLTFVTTVSTDKSALSFVSKSGSSASSISDVSLTRVYDVENFESYSATGTGWSSKNGNGYKYTATGAVAHYYADYYGSNTIASPLGGSGWSLMGSTDYMTYTSNKGRNGSKAVAFKGNSNSLRFIQMNAYYGVPEFIGKGAYLSFWAKGPYSDSGLSTNSSNAAKIKLFGFYNAQVTASNQGTRTEKEFTIPAGSGWTEYRMPLDLTKNYYSFGLLCNQSATTYTIIDDITIYTTNPYRSFNDDKADVALPQGNFKGSTSILGVSCTIILALGELGNYALKVVNATAPISSFTYNNGSLTIVSNATTTFIDASGNSHDITVGTVTGTYNQSQNKFTISASGGSTNISNVSLSVPSSNYWILDSGLTSEWRRRYGDPWVNESTSEALMDNTNQYIGGGHALTLKPNASGRVALSRKTDFNYAQSVKNIAFWVYNPSDSDITLRMWIYTAKSYGSNAETGSVTALARRWTFCSMGFGSKNIYNFQIADFTESGAPLTFDNIMIFA